MYSEENVTVHTAHKHFKNSWLPVPNWLKVLISTQGEKHWKAWLGLILVFPPRLMWSFSFHVIKFSALTLLNLMILNINLILNCL